MVLTMLYVNGHAEEAHLMSERRYHLVRNVRLKEDNVFSRSVGLRTIQV